MITKHTFRREASMAQLESLPNDVLLDLFEYLDIIDLLRAFSRLNFRFHILLYKQFRAYHLHLQHISKPDFDFLCGKRLRSIRDRIISCRLINNDETPGLIDLFYSRGFRINQFRYLQSLTVHDIRDKSVADMLDGLVHLIDLNIIKCTMSPEAENASKLIDRIWSRPKLRHCKLEKGRISGCYFDSHTVVSSTLEHLTIRYWTQPLNTWNLACLLSLSPSLRILSLNIDLADDKEQEKLAVVNTSITTLKLVYQGGTRQLGKLLQSMPNLRDLTIRLVNIRLDGLEWERLINQYAPQLELLRFKMSLGSQNDQVSDQEIDVLLDTFRTPFWLHERRWYVRCEVAHKCLYTVPYAFDFGTTGQLHPTLILNKAASIRPSKWTCPDDSKYWLSNRVHKFECTMQAENSSYLYPACFPNIHKLTLRIPSHETIWRILPTFEHVTTLHISFQEEGSESKLQVLFNQAHHLHTLTIDYFMNVSALMKLFQLRSTSIRRIRFMPNVGRAWHHFDDAYCTTFANSPLAQQCEVLVIRVISPDSVVKLVGSMTKLRALTAHVRDDEKGQPRRTYDELIEWMQRHLPRRCWINSTPPYGDPLTVQLWFD